MKTAEEIVKDDLDERMRQIKLWLDGAQHCLKARAYLQCSVRLEAVIPHVTFNEFQRGIMESINKGQQPPF